MLKCSQTGGVPQAVQGTAKSTSADFMSEVIIPHNLTKQNPISYIFFKFFIKPPPRLLHHGSALFFRLFRRSQLRTIFVNKFPYTVKIRNYLCRMPLAQFKLYFISVNIICYIVCAFPTNAQWNHIAIIYK